MGLQTVTWLLDGVMVHEDSLGSVASIEPGQLNWMTAGAGIAHAERHPDLVPSVEGPGEASRIHGVQMWVALPDSTRDGPPAFETHAELPRYADGELCATVLAGDLFGLRSPAREDSPIVGAELRIDGAGEFEVPVSPDFEHALFAVEGVFEIEAESFDDGCIVHLGMKRERLAIRTLGPARVMLIGGAPFNEELLMWWNFVGRTEDEIRAAHADWEARERFAPIPNFDGERIGAPPLPGSRR